MTCGVIMRLVTVDYGRDLGDVWGYYEAGHGGLW